MWAFALIAIFGFTAVAPGLLADDTANVPACCRRFGKHHCSLLLEDRGGPSLKGVCASYSQRPSIAVAPLRVAILDARSEASGLPAAAYVPAAILTPRVQTSLDKARPQRGPPGLFL